MNAKNLIAAVFALSAATSAFADQNMTHIYAGQTRADASASQQGQKAGTVKTIALAKHVSHGQNFGG